MWAADVRRLSVSAFLAGYFFVSPIPHTAALRSLCAFMLVGLLVLMWRKGRENSAKFIRFRNPEFWALGILTLWMFVQSLGLAIHRMTSLENLCREWLGTLLITALGYEVARSVERLDGAINASRLIAWITLGLVAHAIWELLFQVMQLVQNGKFEIGSTPYGDYAILSTPINMAFALLIADIGACWLGQGKLFPWSARITGVLLSITALAVIAVKARNGVITVFVLLALVAVMLAWQKRQEWRFQRIVSGAGFAILIAVTLLTVNMRSDQRWASFLETVPVALDTNTHRAWLDKETYPLPILSSGAPVEASAYDRIAWGKVAMEGIASRPQGFGYGLGAFGIYVQEQYGGKNFVSSHSGILDFTLSNGLPGLVLLLVFCALLFRRGWLAWLSGNAWGLALMLTLTNYFVRIILDGHFGSFRLKMVALLLGCLYWLTVRKSHADD